MKKYHYLLSLLIILLHLTSDAQNWSFFNPSDTIFFQKKDLNSTFYKDGANVSVYNTQHTLLSSGWSQYDLNKMLTKTDSFAIQTNCNPDSGRVYEYGDNIFGHALKIKADSCFLIFENAQYLIYAKANNAYQWGDSTGLKVDSITIEYKDLNSEFVLDTDSLKQFWFSDGNKVTLSKKYGLVNGQFKNLSFKIAGIHNEGIGLNQHYSDDIYHYNVGDEFRCFSRHYEGGGPNSGTLETQTKILSKTISDDQEYYKYVMKVFGKDPLHGFFTRYDNIQIEIKNNVKISYLPGQIIPILENANKTGVFVLKKDGFSIGTTNENDFIGCSDHIDSNHLERKSNYLSYISFSKNSGKSSEIIESFDPNYQGGQIVNYLSFSCYKVTSVNEIDATKKVHFFPNPASTLLNLNVQSTQKEVELSLVSITGKTIIEVPKNTMELDVSNLPRGLYILVIQERGKPTSFEKVILE